MKVIVKLGIYEIREKDISVSAMCDRALIAAKSIKGKYNITYSYYDDKMRKELLLEQYINNEMQVALNEDQFKVYFRPKYSLESEKIAGAEALVRWAHPTRGFMSPAEFIPLFEKMDLYRRWIIMFGIKPVNLYLKDCVKEKAVFQYQLMFQERIPTMKIFL